MIYSYISRYSRDGDLDLLKKLLAQAGRNGPGTRY